MTFRTELRTDQTLDYSLFNAADELSRYRIPLQCVYPLDELINTNFLPFNILDPRGPTILDAEGVGQYKAGMLLYDTNSKLKIIYLKN